MKFGYVIVYVEDVKATMAFYTAAFGFEEKMVYEENGVVDYGELQTGQETILGFASHSLGEMNLKGQYQKGDLADRPLGFELAFVSEDVSAAFEKAVAAGAIALSEPKEKPWGQTVAYVRATEGTIVEICSPINN